MTSKRWARGFGFRVRFEMGVIELAIQIPYSDGLNERQRQRVKDFNPSSGLVYSIKETAEILSVSPRTVQRMIKSRELETFQISGRPRIPAGSIAKLLHTTGGGDDEHK